MEPIFWTAIGASGVVAVIIARLAAKHGLAWVQAQIKARATGAESEFKQKVSAAVGDLDAKIEAALAPVKADVAALKTKVAV